MSRAAEITTDRIKRALVTMAYIVTRHGEQYAPLFDRLEAELDERMRRPSATTRAQALLERYTVEGGMKAIR